MLTYTCFQQLRWSTASRETKFKKRNHACLIRFLSTMLIGSKVISRSPVPVLIVWKFTSFCCLLLQVYYHCLLALRVQMCAQPWNLIKMSSLSMINEHALPLEKFWQCCNVHFHSQFRIPETRLLQVCGPLLTSHAWFLFGMQFVGFDILHNTSTVYWIISPATTIQDSKILIHQINTVLLRNTGQIFKSPEPSTLA